MLRAGAPGPGTTLPLPLPPPGLGRRAPPRPTVERIVSCSPVAFNDIKHLARSRPADGPQAQDVVPLRCGCWVAHIAIFRRGDWFLVKAHRLAPTLSRCSACNHLEIAAGDGHGWPLERCC